MVVAQLLVQHTDEVLESAARALRVEVAGELRQNLEVMKRSQELLRRLQSLQVGRLPSKMQLGNQLEGVAQLLDRNPNLVQAFRIVERPRGVDRLFQPGRAREHARRHEGRRLALDLFQIDNRGFIETVQLPKEIRRIDLVEHRATPATTLGREGTPDSSGAAKMAARLEGVEQLGRDVDLAHRPERSSQAAREPLKLFPLAVATRDDGDELSQTPGGHPHLMDIFNIAIERPGKCCPDSANVAIDQ